MKGCDSQRKINVKNISLLALDKFHVDFTLHRRVLSRVFAGSIEQLIYFGERVVASTASIHNAVICSVDVADFDLDSL